MTTAFSSSVDTASALALQPDGKILAVGSSNFHFALARYNADGSLDTSFGTRGKVITTIGVGGGTASAVALQPDGKIVAGGASYDSSNGNFTLVRYNADGSIDTSFGTNGIVTTDILGHDDAVTGLAIEPDGKIVAAGNASTGSVSDFAVVRYNPDGSLDSSFGKVTTSFGPSDSVATALVLQPDGRIVVGGRTGSDTNTEVALARYNANGSLDSSFGTGGKVTTGLDSGQGINALALQADGKIVAAGDLVSGTFIDALARYDPDGSLDKTFGDGGLAQGGDNVPYAVAVQSDGRIVTAGQGFSENPAIVGFGLARFNADGTPDTSFGPHGYGSLVTSLGSGQAGANAIALQPDGEIVALGTTEVTPGKDYDFALARYLGSTVTITTSGDGTGTVTSTPSGIHCGSTCSAPFAPVKVTLAATASSRSFFTGWSGDCTGTGSCTLSETTDHRVTAMFTALCVVPRLEGKTLRNAKRALRLAHCSLGRVRGGFSTKVPKGRVVSQAPGRGAKLKPHAKVLLELSKGRRALHRGR